MLVIASGALLIQTLKILEQLWDQAMGKAWNNFKEHERESPDC